MTSKNVQIKLISHRGNIDGPKSEKENDPGYILKALSLRYDVEVDVWYIDGNFYLGHDYPKYLIQEDFLEKEGLWCHAKNLDSLHRMLLNNSIHCFWHQEDNFTLTSKNVIWTFPGNILTKNSVCVLPERSNYSDNEIKKCFGVCSDYIKIYG